MQDSNIDSDCLNEIVEIMFETVCTARKTALSRYLVFFMGRDEDMLKANREKVKNKDRGRKLSVATTSYACYETFFSLPTTMETCTFPILRKEKRCNLKKITTLPNTCSVL